MATENRHDATRYQICRWCCVKVGNKGKIATLTGQTRQLYIKYFEPIDGTDNYRPLVVCVMCKLYLARASMGSPPKKFPSRFPWSTLLATRFNTCSFLKYNTGGERCALCVQKLHDLVHEEKQHKQSVIQASDGSGTQKQLVFNQFFITTTSSLPINLWTNKQMNKQQSCFIIYCKYV